MRGAGKEVCMRNTNVSPRQLISRLEKKYQTKLQIQQNQTIFHKLWDRVTDRRGHNNNSDVSPELRALGGYEYLAR